MESFFYSVHSFQFLHAKFLDLINFAVLLQRSMTILCFICLQINLPEQTELLTKLKFSPVERHFYEKQEEVCMNNAMQVLLFVTFNLIAYLD